MAIVYTTLARTKTYLGETGTSNDTLLTALIESAEDAVNVFCKGRSGRSLLSTTYTRERADGGSSSIVVANGPVTSVTTIEIGNESPYSTLYSSALADSLNSVIVTEKDGRIIRLSGVVGTPQGLFMATGDLVNRKNLMVTYVAGYAATPASLELAIWKIVGKMFSTETRSAEGVKRYRTGDIEVEYGDTSSNAAFLSKDIERLLIPFKQFP